MKKIPTSLLVLTMGCSGCGVADTLWQCGFGPCQDSDGEGSGTGGDDEPLMQHPCKQIGSVQGVSFTAFGDASRTPAWLGTAAFELYWSIGFPAGWAFAGTAPTDQDVDEPAELRSVQTRSDNVLVVQEIGSAADISWIQVRDAASVSLGPAVATLIPQSDGSQIAFVGTNASSTYWTIRPASGSAYVRGWVTNGPAVSAGPDAGNQDVTRNGAFGFLPASGRCVLGAGPDEIPDVETTGGGPEPEPEPGPTMPAGVFDPCMLLGGGDLELPPEHVRPWIATGVRSVARMFGISMLLPPRWEWEEPVPTGDGEPAELAGFSMAIVVPPTFVEPHGIAWIQVGPYGLDDLGPAGASFGPLDEQMPAQAYPLDDGTTLYWVEDPPSGDVLWILQGYLTVRGWALGSSLGVAAATPAVTAQTTSDGVGFVPALGYCARVPESLDESGG